MVMLIEGQAIWSESRHLVLWSHKGRCTISCVNPSLVGEASIEGKLEKKGEAPRPRVVQTWEKVHRVFAHFCTLGTPLWHSSHLRCPRQVSAKIQIRISCRYQWSRGLLDSFLLWRKTEAKGRSSPCLFVCLLLRWQRSLSVQLFEGKMGLYLSAYFKCIFTECCGEDGYREPGDKNIENSYHLVSPRSGSGSWGDWW